MPSEIIDIALHVILQGLVYAFVVMGVYLSSRVIQLDDLTTEGSFGLGGAVTALGITLGLSSSLAFPLAMMSGALAGTITGLLHTKMKMNNLISGLVVTTALFSICLKLAKSYLSLPQDSSIFAGASSITAIVILGALAAAAYLGLKFFLTSEVGLLFRAAGSSPQMATSLGKNVESYKIAGLALANSLTALAGSLFVQWNGYFSITGNVGTLVTGLAGLILAEMISPKFGIGLILGAILYQAIFAITIEFELEPMWNNLIKAALIVVLIQLKPRMKSCST